MWLLLTCTLVTTLYATSLTIANVSLPQIQGALSASPDQVAWVVTSNLIATAVTIPLAGWISSRFGRRRAMLWGITGFGAATVMCGFATSLGELVFWRVLQSAFGSPLTPISQSVVIDEFTGARRGQALSIYSMGVGIPPTIAPLFGGYISETISWRWVFFILIPLALVAFVGVLTAIRPDPPREERPKLDWIGFLSLSMTVACIQLMLDRGERTGWFGSMEIVVACALAVLFGWIFLAHSLTKDRPFLDPRLLLERNFALGIGISAIFGMLFMTPIVIIPTMLQQLRDLPEFTVGMLIAARGAGTMLASLIMILFALPHRLRPAYLCRTGDGAFRNERVAVRGCLGNGFARLRRRLAMGTYVAGDILEPRSAAFAGGRRDVSFRAQHRFELLHIGEHRCRLPHPEDELQRAGKVDQSVQ